MLLLCGILPKYILSHGSIPVLQGPKYRLLKGFEACYTFSVLNEVWIALRSYAALGVASCQKRSWPHRLATDLSVDRADINVLI